MGRLGNLASATEEKRIQAETESTGQNTDTFDSSQRPQSTPQSVPQPPSQTPLDKPQEDSRQVPLQARPMDDEKIRPGEAAPRHYKLPAELEEFDDFPGLLDRWSTDYVDATIQSVLLNRKQDEKTKDLELRFFNAAREPDTETQPLRVKWHAFPQNLDDADNKWEEADKRGNQDEYCEWEVRRNDRGELVSVTFTTEVPEYFKFIASTGTSKLASTYSDLNDCVVKSEELLRKAGGYYLKNRWNFRGKNTEPQHQGAIAHLLRENNFLLSLVGLVVDAAFLVPDPNNPGKYLTDYKDRLPYLPTVSDASPGRDSDPRVAEQISLAVLSKPGKRVTITNPIGPYIAGFEHEKIKGYRDVKSCWHIERESGKYAVRATFKIPSRFVGQLKDHKGHKIEFGSQIAQYIWIEAQVGVASLTRPNTSALPPQPIFSFIEGREVRPKLLDVKFVHDEISKDPFGRYLATREDPGLTLKDLLNHQKDHTWIAYAADEGIGIKFKPPRTEVRVRLVIICTPGNPTSHPENGSRMADPESMVKKAFKVPTFAIVAVPPFDDKNNIHSERSILQVASFNPAKGWFNFYDRERRGVGGAAAGKWVYFGCSKDAFTPDTQGLGPFCGHANGTLTMKESEEPWPHWHTSKNPLELPDSHPMMDDLLFRDQDSGWYFEEADHLARMIAASTKAWFIQRRYIDFGASLNPHPVAKRVHQWVAHVCLTTTVGLSCSKGGRAKFKIPSDFFFNSSALSEVLSGIRQLEDAILPCEMTLYNKAKEDIGLSTMGNIDGKLTQVSSSEGPTPWKVIVPSNDDVEGIRQILQTGLLPKRVLIALLMVDFWNPVFSRRRARLMRYVPSEATYVPTYASAEDRYKLGEDLEAAVRDGMKSLGRSNKSPEAEFLGLVERTDLEEHAIDKIREFVGKVNANLKSVEGVKGYLRVAETRRRLFRPPQGSRASLHPLAEFEMSVPYSTQMPGDEAWSMKSDASSVQDKGTSGGTWHPRNTQAHFSSAGCPFSAPF